MFLKLLSPASRNRKYWSCRGTYNGKRYDRSTGQTARQEAQKVAQQFENEIISGHADGDVVTFSMAAHSYMKAGIRSKRDENWLIDICAYIGGRPIKEITLHEIKAIANNRYPKGKSSSKNRAVIRPIASVMHWAAKNKWCDWLKIEIYKEPTPETRFLTFEEEKAIYHGLRFSSFSNKLNKHLLILWTFRQGERIGDIINTKYEHIDFKRGLIRRHISKSDRYAELPLDDVILRYLKKQSKKAGYIFIWRTRHAVNKWIRELNKLTGVYYTPHMARHTLGKRLNDAGVGLRTIMQTLGQSDPKSAMRYQTTDTETIRQAKKKAQIFGVRIGEEK